MLEHMERERVDYVVLESLGFRRTDAYLVPAARQYKNRFQVLWYDQAIRTVVLRFLPATP